MLPRSSEQRPSCSPYDVSIVICTHNRAGLLGRTLVSLSELDVPADTSVELVVVPNACSDDTVEVVHRASRRIPYPVRVVEERDPGLSLARNRGLTEARADLIAFLDDDVWVEREWLRAMVHVARNVPAQLLAGRVVLEWESGRPPWSSPAVERLLSANDLGHELRECARANALVGANFALRRSVVAAVGDFCPALGRLGSNLMSGEESDLVERALSAGHRLVYVPRMSVRHWIPAERATIEHLKTLALGRGRSRMVLQRERPGKGWMARVRLGIAQMLIGGTRAALARWRRDDAARIAGSLLYHRGRGALDVLVRLWPGLRDSSRGQPRREARA